jgi:hypothetical protein
MNTKRLEPIEQQIEKIKVELQQVGILRPGSLTQQYRNPKEQTGAFYQLSYTYRMKSRSEYIRPQFVPEVRVQIENYKRFRELVDKWIELGIQYSQLAMKLEAKKLDGAKRTTRARRKDR